jgi:hypothetical protein
MKDEKKPIEDVTKPKTSAASEKKEEEGGPSKKLGYVFKIVPADPKNAFDFEDVADK